MSEKKERITSINAVYINVQPGETYHIWQRLFKYVTDCRPESTKT